jgi:hypothetical protein
MISWEATLPRIAFVEGTPGTGKTTLSLQFLLDGASRGETGLYIILSETKVELNAVAATPGWSLDKISLIELVNETGLDPDNEQTILHPTEVTWRNDARIDEASRCDPSVVVMPGGMNGAQLAVQARKLRPDLKILLTSGYVGHKGDHHVFDQGLPVLNKPYRRDELAEKFD